MGINDSEEIKDRTIVIRLSDQDAMNLMDYAAESGMTINQLIENFIYDLVGSKHSNGWDERLYALNWYRRCGFERCEENTFAQYLLKSGEFDEICHCLEEINYFTRCIERTEEELQTGKMISSKGEEYTWEELMHGDGTRCYICKEEWEKKQKECIAEYIMDRCDYKKSVSDAWESYLVKESKISSREINYEDEIRKVLELKMEINLFVNGEPQMQEIKTGEIKDANGRKRL